MRTRRVIFGIDFSGAKDEGSKIWIAKGIPVGSKLLESECLNARDLTNYGSRLAGTDESKFWIMSWGASALVLEPESLKDEIL
jgi:hypothetical protein